MHPGLQYMAFNLSLAAAEIYNGFDSVDWVAHFEEKAICDLDYGLVKPSLLEGGTQTL
jgi:hypothetical protein